MVLRRRRLLRCLLPNEIAPYVTGFPLLGVGDNFVQNGLPFEAIYSDSQYVPDYLINPHPRYGTLVRNIRARRQGKVNIRVPLFKDEFTPEYMRAENSSGKSGGGTETPPRRLRNGSLIEEGTDIHMDCMAFGMGMCSLQVTLQSKDVKESRYIYDQLAVLAPIMLAMTASSPIFKGRLADIDARWTVISQSVDDRTPAERGEVPPEEVDRHRQDGMAGQGVRRQAKSRYDSISTYLYHCEQSRDCERTFAVYNDVPCPVDEEVKQMLLDNHVDMNLAHHLAHLFTRDALVVFNGMIEMDDERSMEHFENIQSTNWQTVRWKPPPPRLPDSPYIGELRGERRHKSAFAVALRTMGWKITFYCTRVRVTAPQVGGQSFGQWRCS